MFERQNPGYYLSRNKPVILQMLFKAGEPAKRSEEAITVAKMRRRKNHVGEIRHGYQFSEPVAVAGFSDGFFPTLI